MVQHMWSHGSVDGYSIYLKDDVGNALRPTKRAPPMVVKAGVLYWSPWSIVPFSSGVIKRGHAFDDSCPHRNERELGYLAW